MVKNTSKLKIVFFGTPEFAIPSFESIITNDDFEIVAVVSQTSKAKGRGCKIVDPQVVEVAKKYSIANIFQPQSISKIKLHAGKLEINENENPEAYRLCKTLNENQPDIGVVVAYGKIIPESILNFPKFGLINLHPSDLPRWRGAAPLQHTLLAGDKSTRICIIQLSKELDAGPILNSFFLEDISNEDFYSLQDLTAKKGAELLTETLNNFRNNNIIKIEQSSEGVTYAHKWGKDNCHLKWKEPDDFSLNRIRASSPNPGAFTFFNGKKVKILKAAPREPEQDLKNISVGQIELISDSRFAIATGNGRRVEILELQIEGKNKIKAIDFLNSNNLRSRLRTGESIFFTDQ